VLVTVNGDELVVDAATTTSTPTVADVLAQLGLGARWVLVERNGEPVERRAIATTALSDGDRLELVRAVAGG
jgi:sulfur carrier protein